jgi:hypothetical protein
MAKAYIAAELEAKALAAIRCYERCESVIGVTVHQIDDPELAFNWGLSNVRLGASTVSRYAQRAMLYVQSDLRRDYNLLSDTQDV